MKKMNKKGFTLVEIMIVVAIIGLLAAIGIPSFQKARENSIAKSKQNNARIASGAVEMYATETAATTVSQDLIEGYIKGGWASLKVGDSPATFPTAGTDVSYWSTNLTVIVDAMYNAAAGGD